MAPLLYFQVLVGQGLSMLPATSSAVSPATHGNIEGPFMKPLGPLTKSSIVTPSPAQGISKSLSSSQAPGIKM